MLWVLHNGEKEYFGPSFITVRHIYFQPTIEVIPGCATVSYKKCNQMHLFAYIPHSACYSFAPQLVARERAVCSLLLNNLRLRLETYREPITKNIIRYIFLYMPKL